MVASHHDPRWVVATDAGVDLYDADAGLRLDVLPELKHGEQMTVSYRDRYTIMSGSRSGRVRFADTRGGSLNRLRHSSAVNAIRTLNDNNYVLVSGLQSMSLYDLRYTPTPNRYRKQKSKAPTTPYILFNIPQNRMSDRYGLGFDMDSELGIVASATSSGSSHHVSLYSVHTGKKMRDSPLNKSFDNPITCIKMTRVRDGPKSILLASGGQIEEWTAMGIGGDRKG